MTRKIREVTGKTGNYRKKIGKIGKESQKSGSFFHFAPSDREGWLRHCSLVSLNHKILYVVAVYI